jgi:formylglycine-generating enzyme required for sulfatase activity
MYKCQNGISIGHPIPVGSLGRNGYGLSDMYGNVAEWCQDYWGERPIQHSHVTDPQGPSKGFGRVVRGGSWESLPVSCLSGYSIGELQESKNRNTGFRLIIRKKR